MQKLPWPNRRKSLTSQSDTLSHSRNVWKPLHSMDDCNYNVTEIDDYPKCFSLLNLVHEQKRYPENFRKMAPVVLIWQMFRSSLLSIKPQLSMLSHACHSKCWVMLVTLEARCIHFQSPCLLIAVAVLNAYIEMKQAVLFLKEGLYCIYSYLRKLAVNQFHI